MAHEPHETGLNEMPEEPGTNVIVFTPSGQTPSDLPPGHSAEILQMGGESTAEETLAALQRQPN